MASSIYSGKAVIYGINQQGTYGTALGVTDNMIQLSCANTNFAEQIFHRQPDRNYPNQNWPDISDLANDSYGSIHSVNIATEALREELALWLMLAFQNVEEDVGTPFSKAYYFHSPVLNPIDGGEGLFATIMGCNQIAGASEYIADAVVRKLDLSLSSTDNDGNLYVNAEVIGRLYGQNITPDIGTYFTKTNQEKFNFHLLQTCTINDGGGADAIIPYNLTLTIENEWVPVGYDNSNETFQYLGLLSRTAKLTGSVLWDTNGQNLLTCNRAGTESVLSYSWGSVGVDGYLIVNARGIFEDAQINYGNEPITVDFTFNIASDTANSENALGVTLCDAVDWGF